MSERRNWVERNIFHQHQPQPWERVRYQVEEDRPITGRIEVYTGHGLQKVGMGKDLWEQSSIVREIYTSAERASGIKVAEISFEGPEDLLNRTENAQVLIPTYSVACKAMLVEDNPLRFRRFSAVNIGQSAAFGIAAYEAGSFGNPYEFKSFEKMIRFYKERGLIMQEVSDAVGGGLVVVGVRKKRGEEASPEQVDLITHLRENCKEFNVELALDVAPDQVILGGSNAEIESFQKGVADEYEQYGIRTIRSKASSGPFHIERYMKPADQPIRDLIRSTDFEDPKSLVVANTRRAFLRTADEIEQEFGDLTIMPVLGRDMDALVAEHCRGIMYFIGGDRAIAQDMFVDSAGGKKPIYRSKKFLAAAGLTVGTGAAIAIAAQKRRPSKKS